MGVQSAPKPWIWRGSQGPTHSRTMERLHLALAVASCLVALAWIPHRADATASLKLGVSSHPELQERAAEMMAIIRMVDASDRNLITWVPQFKTGWSEYKHKVHKDPETWYCQKFKQLQEDLTNLIGQIKLIRSGIAAKRAQLQDIRDILSNSQLNGKSGLHCDKGSTEAICEILDKLDKDNDQEEAELNTEEQAIAKEEINVENYSCNCKMNQWENWGKCSATCGQGTHKRTRKVMWELRNGGNACPEDEEVRPCTDQCCAVDCVYSEWAPWTDCPEKCDGKVHKISRVRVTKTPMACGGKTCLQVDPAGFKEEKDCEILQVKANIVRDWERNITKLETQLKTLKGKFCDPNPCEHSTVCKVGEATDKATGLKHPVSECQCGTDYTGPWCGQSV